MRLTTPVIVTVAGVAWLTRRERNPARWPGYLRTQGAGIARDLREAVVDGGRAGVRAEKAFDADHANARSGARTW
jgi:hypothetical protein